MISPFTEGLAPFPNGRQAGNGTVPLQNNVYSQGPTITPKKWVRPPRVPGTGR